VKAENPVPLGVQVAKLQDREGCRKNPDGWSAMCNLCVCGVMEIHNSICSSSFLVMLHDCCRVV